MARVNVNILGISKLKWTGMGEFNSDDRYSYYWGQESLKSSEIETSVKGSHFPVGVVPPRTKSPTPESSTIASYVTLRKTKKMMDSRTERPRSAVEQLCLAESTRPRMTVEEQMERIRRHQQACLREKKKGLNLIGALDQSPLPSPSNLRDNPFRITQVYISVVFTHKNE